MLENTLEVFKNKCPVFYPRRPNIAWNSSSNLGPIFIFCSYKDPYARVLVPKPGEDKREKIIQNKETEFQVSKVTDAFIELPLLARVLWQPLLNTRAGSFNRTSTAEAGVGFPIL